jgi:dTDP-4-dehydrorhamnose reductase
MRTLLTGATGNLGSYLLRELRAREADVVAWSGSTIRTMFGVTTRPVDLADPDKIARNFKEAGPSLVIHAGAVASVADCYRDRERAEKVNVQGSKVLSELAADARARIMFISTDLVFDGEQGAYREPDEPRPLSAYGRTKLAAEAAVLTNPRSAVVRVSLLFGPTLVGRPSFFDKQMAALREHNPIRLFSDEWRTPLGLATAARALILVADSDFTGILHMGGRERLSRVEMGERLADFLGIDEPAIIAESRNNSAAAEPRPRDLALDSSLWREQFSEQPWPGYRENLAEMLGS